MNRLIRIASLLWAAFFVVLVTQPVQAGTLTYVKTATGTKTIGSASYPWTSPVPSTGGGSVSTSGTFKFDFTYTPSSTTEMIPRSVKIPVAGSISVQSMSATATVSGSITIGSKGSGAPTATTSNGMYQKNWGLGGSVLYQIPRGGESSNGVVQKFTVSIPASASFSSSNPNQYGGNVAVEAGMPVGQPVLDTRTVQLSRSGATNDWNTNEGGVPVTYGDTTYSYTSHQAYSTPTYESNYQTINSALSGGWSTDSYNTSIGRYNVTWNWAQQGVVLETGTTAGDHYDHAARIATQGGVDYWKDFNGGEAQWCDANGNFSAKSPAAAILKYFARDNTDDVTAEGRYILTVHEPIELIEKRVFIKAYAVYSPAYAPNPANPGQWIVLDVIMGPRPAGYTITINKGEAKSTAYSVGFDGTIKVFDVAIGVAYQHQAGQSWYKEVGISIPGPELSPTQRAYVEIEFAYQRFYSTYRLYNKSGEIRRSGSPAVPALSLPYKSTWDEPADANPSPRWKILEEGQPSPAPKNEVPVYSGDPITAS